jgi:hypothetical protein
MPAYKKYILFPKNLLIPLKALCQVFKLNEDPPAAGSQIIKLKAMGIRTHMENALRTD